MDKGKGDKKAKNGRRVAGGFRALLVCQGPMPGPRPRMDKYNSQVSVSVLEVAMAFHDR